MSSGYHTIFPPTKIQDKADSPPHPSNADDHNAADDDADDNAADNNADNDTDNNADNNDTMQTTDDDANDRQRRR